MRFAADPPPMRRDPRPVRGRRRDRDGDSATHGSRGDLLAVLLASRGERQIARPRRPLPEQPNRCLARAGSDAC